MPYFDALTGQLVQPGSVLFFVVLLVMGVGFYLWSKHNHPAYERLEDAFKRELAELRARASASYPKFEAELKAKFDELKAKIDSLK